MGSDRNKGRSLVVTCVSAVRSLKAVTSVKGTLRLVNKNGSTDYPRRPTQLLLFAVKCAPTPEHGERKPGLCSPTTQRVRADGAQNRAVLEFEGSVSFLGKGQM